MIRSAVSVAGKLGIRTLAKALHLKSLSRFSNGRDFLHQRQWCYLLLWRYYEKVKLTVLVKTTLVPSNIVIVPTRVSEAKLL